ncbi:MAG: pyoverdine signaling pathway anti-sigma factor FpvR [Sphingomonadales bacterium]
MNATEQQKSRIEREAAEWCVLLAGGDASDGDKARFAEWLVASPSHVRAYQMMEALWHETAEFGGDLDPDSAVVALFPGMHNRHERAGFGAFRRVRRLALNHAMKLAAGVLLAMLVGAYFLIGSNAVLPWRQSETLYQTAVGESRLIKLADGSVIELNTDSRVAVTLTDQARHIRLMRGEAYFIVAKDKARPFTVSAEDAFVRAVGTEFNVKSLERQLAVTVIEGKVIVGAEEGRGEGEAWRHSLERNQQLIVKQAANADRQQALVSNAIDTKSLIAWRERKLIFDATPLHAVIADFNRYNDMRLEIIDPAIAEIAISGVFNPRDPIAFANTIAVFPQISVRQSQDKRIELSARGG